MSIPASPLPHSGLGVLDNEDILERIFEHFIVESRSTTGPILGYTRALLWGGITCKAFLNPAMNVLWYSMNSMIPLLKLLEPFHLNNGTYVSPWC